MDRPPHRAAPSLTISLLHPCLIWCVPLEIATSRCHLSLSCGDRAIYGVPPRALVSAFQLVRVAQSPRVKERPRFPADCIPRHATGTFIPLPGVDAAAWPNLSATFARFSTKRGWRAPRAPRRAPPTAARSPGALSCKARTAQWSAANVGVKLAQLSKSARRLPIPGRVYHRRSQVKAGPDRRGGGFLEWQRAPYAHRGANARFAACNLQLGLSIRQHAIGYKTVFRSALMLILDHISGQPHRDHRANSAPASACPNPMAARLNHMRQ